MANPELMERFSREFAKVPIIQKQAAVTGPKPLPLEFRYVPQPTFSDTQVDAAGDPVMLSPPHWEIRDEHRPDPIAWGPIETGPLMHRLFAIAAVCTSLLPPEEIEGRLSAMQIGNPREVNPEKETE